METMTQDTILMQVMQDRSHLIKQCETLIGMVNEMLPKAGPCGWGTIETESAQALIDSIVRRNTA